jgi:uncharacterized membrane protein YhhN
MNFRIHSLLYFGIGIAFIVLETIGFIIPVLIWLYLRFISGESNRFHRMILLALFFSWGGDVLLQLTQFNEEFFLLGLGSFLLAQVIYSIAFFATGGKNILAAKPWLVLPLLAYGFLILWRLWGGLGDMKIPVTVYCVVILTMLLGAMNRKLKVNPQSYRMLLAGAILFVLSDSLIAINKFVQPFELARVAIMTSYITAQYLIALGCVRQYNLVLKAKNT